MAEDDPLTELYSDEAPFDRARLASDLETFVRVDPETGDPIRQPKFASLSPEGQVVSLLLYRKAAAELGDIDADEEPVKVMWLDRNSDADELDVAEYPFELEFVHQADENGILFVPDHEVGAALDFLGDSS